jgi:hypothetical protein
VAGRSRRASFASPAQRAEPRSRIYESRLPTRLSVSVPSGENRSTTRRLPPSAILSDRAVGGAPIAIARAAARIAVSRSPLDAFLGP